MTERDPNSFDLLATAKAHFHDQIAGLSTALEVPEWGLTLHVRPANLRERARMVVLARAGDLEGMAEMLVLRARTAEGKPVFQRAQLDELATRVDTRIVERIAQQIMQFDADNQAALEAGTGDVVEGIEKN